MWRLAGTALKIQIQIATRPKKRHLLLAWFKNWHLSWSLNPTIKCLLTTTTYCCLEAQLTMTKQLQVSLLGFSIKNKPQDIKHTDSWANGRLITTTLYLISRSDQFCHHISWHLLSAGRVAVIVYCYLFFANCTTSLFYCSTLSPCTQHMYLCRCCWSVYGTSS